MRRSSADQEIKTAASTQSFWVADGEAYTAFSRDEGSSDDCARISSAGGLGKRKKRTRQKTSCETCKARKVKCDRAEPACSWCARHNRLCIYLERQTPSSRSGSNFELEAKINRLDALLQALDRRVDEHVAHDHFNAAPAPSASTTNRTSSTADSVQHERGGVCSNDFPLTAPTLTQRTSTSSVPRDSVYNGNAMDKRQTDGQLSPRSHSNLSNITHIVNILPNFSPNTLPFGRSLSLQSPTVDLPPHDMVCTLVDLYFKHCNTWCPILDRETTFGILFDSTSLDESDRILLHAIVATTLRFFKDPGLSPEMRAHYYATSKHTVQIYVMEHVSIPALRALVIICLDELGTSNGPRGWNLLSLLVQSVWQLGLCEESSVYLAVETEETPSTGSIRRIAAKEPETWIEDEGRRRLCWMAYLLDRYATLATTNFDFILADEKMNRVLPCSYDLFSKNVPVETRPLRSLTGQPGPVTHIMNGTENLGSFSYHCELLAILSKVHNFLKTPVDIMSASDTANWRNTYRSLDRALDEWLQSLPSEYSGISTLCHSDPASRVANWFMLHSAYVTSVVRLHSVAAYPTMKSQFFLPSDYAMQRCLTAVQSLADISRDVIEANGLDLLGPPFAFSLWVGARLLLVHAATTGGTVDPEISFFIKTLREIGQHWEVAENYAKILTRVVYRGQSGHTSFASMRRNAYDLVLLTSTTRHTGLEQTSTQVTCLAELDNIDSYDFFNHPRTSKHFSVSFEEDSAVLYA